MPNTQIILPKTVGVTEILASLAGEIGYVFHQSEGHVRLVLPIAHLRPREYQALFHREDGDHQDRAHVDRMVTRLQELSRLFTGLRQAGVDLSKALLLSAETRVPDNLSVDEIATKFARVCRCAEEYEKMMGKVGIRRRSSTTPPRLGRTSR